MEFLKNISKIIIFFLIRRPNFKQDLFLFNTILKILHKATHILMYKHKRSSYSSSIASLSVCNISVFEVNLNFIQCLHRGAAMHNYQRRAP